MSAGLAATNLTRRLYAQSDLPTPDFTYDEAHPPFAAGLRPYRKGTFRLEAEAFGDKLVVHNYGHGGAGITMSWGCALEVLDLVNAAGYTQPSVAVLGAGVMGLTAASVLRSAGFRVTVYARGFGAETTSHVAGGQWAPSYVEHDVAGPGYELYQRILVRAFRAHAATIGQELGAGWRWNYNWTRMASLDAMPRELIPEPQYFTRLPFAGHTTSGYCYRTMMIEPPKLLRGLEVRLRRAGVRMRRREFGSAAELSRLHQGIIINCLGLGAREVFADQAMVPLKGQLCLLPAQPELDYLYSGHGYIFPRSDFVVVGGTKEMGVEDPTPDPEICRGVVAFAKAAFTGESTVMPHPAVAADAMNFGEF